MRLSLHQRRVLFLFPLVASPAPIIRQVFTILNNRNWIWSGSRERAHQGTVFPPFEIQCDLFGVVQVPWPVYSIFTASLGNLRDIELSNARNVPARRCERDVDEENCATQLHGVPHFYLSALLSPDYSIFGKMVQIELAPFRGTFYDIRNDSCSFSKVLMIRSM